MRNRLVEAKCRTKPAVPPIALFDSARAAVWFVLKTLGACLASMIRSRPGMRLEQRVDVVSDASCTPAVGLGYIGVFVLEYCLVAVLALLSSFDSSFFKMVFVLLFYRVPREATVRVQGAVDVRCGTDSRLRVPGVLRLLARLVSVQVARPAVLRSPVVGAR